MRAPIWKGRRRLRMWSFPGTYANRGSGTEQASSDVADRVGFEPTSLLRDYLISSVVPRTDFSGSWAKITPHIGSLGGPSKPLVSRRFYPQSRMASRKIRTHRISPQNGLQNRKKERIWGERRENRRERKPCFHSKFQHYNDLVGEKNTALLLLAKKMRGA